MIKVRSVLKKAAQRLDLPLDIAAGLPRIEFDGFSQCRLDRHKGILAYEKERIVVSLNIGTVTIEGSGLQVEKMHREALTITGKIARVEFDGSSF